MFPLTPSSPSPSMTFLAPALPFLKWKGTFQQYKYLATIPQECSPPIMTTSYLATSLNFGNPPFSRLNELKNWLKGYITTPDFFTKEPRHALDDLHAALLAVAKEIGMKLDPELEATIHTAGDESHSIQCDEDSFWTTRVLDVHKLCTTGLIGIKTLSRERGTSYHIATTLDGQLTNSSHRPPPHRPRRSPMGRQRNPTPRRPLQERSRPERLQEPRELQLLPFATKGAGSRPEEPQGLRRHGTT